MQREIDRLSSRTFDLLVVGGGIYGLAIAYDAAQRGLDVALVERDDFGSGASFNHLRTIHGGLRYLQTLDLGRARESVRERRTMARIAPHLVKPLSFALPLSRSVTRGKTAMRAGFGLDRIVGFDRNDSVPASHHLASGRVLSRADALALFRDNVAVAPLPGGLTGAALWQDYVTVEADRLTLAFALGAASHGATLANHVEATALVVEGARIAGVRAVDRQQVGQIEIAARVTVDATGAAVGSLTAAPGNPALLHSRTSLPMIRAMNLVTRRDAGELAIGGQCASASGRARNFFMVPWRGRALFGTWESGRVCGPGDATVPALDVDAFLSELNQAFPALALTREAVTLVHTGVVPAAVGPDGRAGLERHEQIRDEVDGLVSVAGTKYTTARAVAERVVNAVLEKIGGTVQRSAVPCRTSETPLPGGDIGDVRATLSQARRDYAAMLPVQAINHLVAAYGSGYRQVVDLAAGRPELRATVVEAPSVIAAQLVWAVREEMAMTLADAVIRRTPIGALGHPGDDVVTRAAAVVSAELGWSDERTRSEIEDVRRFYRWQA